MRVLTTRVNGLNWQRVKEHIKKEGVRFCFSKCKFNECLRVEYRSMKHTRRVQDIDQRVLSLMEIYESTTPELPW